MMGLNWVKHWDSTENIIQYEQGLWYCGSQHAAVWPHLEPLVMIFTRQHTFLRSWAHYTAYFILFKVHFSPQPAHFIYLWLFRRLGFHLLNPVMANGPMSNVISKNACNCVSDVVEPWCPVPVYRCSSQHILDLGQLSLGQAGHCHYRISSDILTLFRSFPPQGVKKQTLQKLIKSHVLVVWGLC